MTIAIETLESIHPYPILWENHSTDKYSSGIIFSSKQEADEMTETLCMELRNQFSSAFRAGLSNRTYFTGSKHKNPPSANKTCIPVRPAPPRPPVPSSEASPIVSRVGQNYLAIVLVVFILNFTVGN